MDGARSRRTNRLAAATVLLLAACGTSEPADHERFLQERGAEIAGNRTFTTCYGHGCAQKTVVRLGEPEWRQVRMLFSAPVAGASEERNRLARAVALLERLVGERVGTSGDLGGTFGGVAKSGQLDCVDETINTTVYLSLLERDGLLRWHRPRAPADRSVFTGVCCWPHKTAAVTEISSGTSYAVDSWFHDNGLPAEVIPLSDWLSGWKPPGFAAPAGR